MSDARIDVRLGLKDEASAPMQRALRDMGQATQGLRSAFLALAPAVAGAFTVRGLASFVSSSISLAAQTETAFKRVEAVVRSTGAAAGFSAQELAAQAGEYQKTLAISADKMMELQAALLTFKGVQGDAFKRAQQAAVDLSYVLGTDAKGAALQLGKALEDPLTGLTALRRAGVGFTEAERERIKVLVESNRLQEAQGQILTAIEGQVGGTAAAALDTYAGATQRLANSWEELKKSVARGWTEGGSAVGFMNALSSAYERVGEAMERKTTAGMQRVAAEEMERALKARAFAAQMLTELEGQGKGLFFERRLAAARDNLARANETLDQALAESTRVGGLLGAKVPQDPWMRAAGQARRDADEAQARRDAAAAKAAEIARQHEASRLRAVPATDRFLERDKGMDAAAKRTREILAARVDEEVKAGVALSDAWQAQEADRWEVISRGAAAAVEAEQARVDAAVASGALLKDTWLSAAQERSDAETRAIEEILARERELEAQRRASTAAAISMAGQLAGDYAGFMRQMYEDSGGQQKKFWEAYKAFAIAETTVSAAAGAMAAYKAMAGIPMVGPALGATAAAMVTAMGAAKVGLIQAQQPAVPFAEGGIVTRPVQGLVGEAGPEAIIPLRRAGEFGLGAGPVTVHINIPVQGGMDARTAAEVAGLARQQAMLGVRLALAEDPGTRRAVRRVR